ncbi:MAG: hypothetical protein WA130_11430 [Candidatus Methanoperedens sp.]
MSPGCSCGLGKNASAGAWAEVVSGEPRGKEMIVIDRSLHRYLKGCVWNEPDEQ